MKGTREAEVFGINRYRNRRVDGHVHTELCPHGSGDKTALMVEKAIELHLEKICFTEHAPLPVEFSKVYLGDKKALDTAALTLDQVETYLALGNDLQKEYGEAIDISLGFEVDYLPGFESYTRSFLDQYGPVTGDNILSLHFMEGMAGGYWCLDYSPQEFENAFGPWIDQQDLLYGRYFETLLKGVRTDFGPYRPKRIGHLDSIKKFNRYFHWKPDLDDKSKGLVLEILRTLKSQGRELDYNLAGLSKEYCGEVYPSRYIQGMAYVLGLPYVVGSDAHSILALQKTWGLGAAILDAQAEAHEEGDV